MGMARSQISEFLATLEKYMPFKELEDEVSLVPDLAPHLALRTYAMGLLPSSPEAQPRDPFQTLADLTVLLLQCVRAEISIPFDVRRGIRERSIAYIETIRKHVPLHGWVPPLDSWILPIRHRYVWHNQLLDAILESSQKAEELTDSAGDGIEGLKAVRAILDCIRELFAWPTSSLYDAHTSKRTASTTARKRREAAPRKLTRDAEDRRTYDALMKLRAYELDVVYPAVKLLTLLGNHANVHPQSYKLRCRLQFDDDSRTITLDGRVVGESLEPEQYEFMKAFEAHGQAGGWISGKEIRKRRGLTGKKLSLVCKKLPQALKKLVRSKRGVGYCLELPLLSKGHG